MVSAVQQTISRQHYIPSKETIFSYHLKIQKEQKIYIKQRNNLFLSFENTKRTEKMGQQATNSNKPSSWCSPSSVYLLAHFKLHLELEATPYDYLPLSSDFDPTLSYIKVVSINLIIQNMFEEKTITFVSHKAYQTKNSIWLWRLILRNIIEYSEEDLLWLLVKIKSKKTKSKYT